MFTMLNEQLYKLALDVTLAVYVTDQGCRDVAHFCCVSEDARIVSRWWWRSREESGILTLAFILSNYDVLCIEIH